MLLATGDPRADAVTASAVDTAVEVLARGGTVVLPTDTVYGIAARVDRPDGVAGIFALKGRPEHNALAVLVADVEQAATLANMDDPRVLRLVERWWPGALTLVLQRRKDATHLDLGGDPTTIGVRCPGSSLARAVAAHAGPIATTSANRHGDATPHEAATAAASLTDAVSLVLDGGTCGGEASTVIDATAPDSGEWRELRAGPIPWASIATVLA
jgi:L-threonylcarbamoyladenylate synthase